ncbi:SigE family RNA polymerase sigma factor [Streptomyces sp. NBC_01304]|uniref:SigE family RNA polymerase sigma factor n=1 Tax=Streptomyces sp. NBC_01304 TaxID=2903818 RepID=UPI002E13F0E6|nr:SigE family RNA polymerase sigma factor [Streptomyces sp. NBC_01304]
MRQASTEAYLEFAAARSGHLFRSACLLTGGDTHFAEDLVQETLGRMYVTWTRIDRIDNPAGYAQTVLIRTFLTQRRRHSSAEAPTGELPDAGPEFGVSGDPALRLTLIEALRQLSPKDRAVVVLRYWEDRSIEATADALHTSSAAVRTRSTRALAQLRALLGDSIGELARP